MKIKISLTLILAVTILTPAFSDQSSVKNFWDWFIKNEKVIYDFEKDQDKVFDSLAEEMGKVNKFLTFEFGPKLENGKREFVISVNGMKEAFPAVEVLYASVPKSDKFIFVKFRPRRTPMPIRYGGKEVDPKDISCKMFEDGSKIGIMLFFKDYKQSEKGIWGMIGYLLLDHSLGEYDVETKVGFIKFLNKDSKYNADSFPMTELAEKFDVYFNTISKAGK